MVGEQADPADVALRKTKSESWSSNVGEVAVVDPSSPGSPVAGPSSHGQ